MKARKDFYGGALLVIVGMYAVVTGLQYKFGSLSRMGPGFFPVAVGVLLALVGTLIALSSRGDEAATAPAHGAHGTPDLRGCVCIVLGVLAFLLIGRYGGLIPATFAIVFICAIGDRTNTLRQAALLALGMCVVAFIVFSWALQLQLPLFGWGN
jgi:hypothetical protein